MLDTVRKCNLINLPSAVAGVDGKTGRTAAYTEICAVWEKKIFESDNMPGKCAVIYIYLNSSLRTSRFKQL